MNEDLRLHIKRAKWYAKALEFWFFKKRKGS